MNISLIENRKAFVTQITRGGNTGTRETLNNLSDGKSDNQFINADFEGGMSVPTAIFTEKGREGIKDAYKNFGGNTKTVLDKTAGSTWRAGSSALTYKAFAEENEKTDQWAHQKANIHYQEYVGNGLISGTARALSEFLYQFPLYTSKDLYSVVTTGEHGQYQPYSLSQKANGGIIDSFEDIGISSGIKDVRQETGYNKAEFEQQFNKWKNEQNNK